MGLLTVLPLSPNSTVQPVPLPVQAVVQHSKKDKVGIILYSSLKASTCDKLNLSFSLHRGTRQTCPLSLSIIAFTFPLELTSNQVGGTFKCSLLIRFGILHQLGQVFSITNQAAVGWLMECVFLAPAGCLVILGMGALRWHHAPEVGLGASRPASSQGERCRQVLVCLRAGACEFVHVIARVLVRSRGPLAALDYATSGTQPAHSRCLGVGGECQVSIQLSCFGRVTDKRVHLRRPHLAAYVTKKDLQLTSLFQIPEHSF